MIRHTVTVSQCNNVTESRSSDVIWLISISALFARKLTSDQDFSFMILKTCLKASKKGNVYMDENPVCDDGWSSLQNTDGSLFILFRSGIFKLSYSIAFVMQFEDIVSKYSAFRTSTQFVSKISLSGVFPCRTRGALF